MKGLYVLLVEIDKLYNIQVGRRWNCLFEEGYYAYVGSALGNLEKRVARHLSAQKKLHWHIDYLLNWSTVREVIYSETSQKKECLIAQALSEKLASKSGFGCSDCHCSSHLFFCRNYDKLRRQVLDSFNLLNLTPSDMAL